MPDRPWRDDEEDWSETGADGDDYDPGYGDPGDGDSDNDLGDAADESIPCPDCGASIYADLDHCPRCGYWLTDSDRNAHQTGFFASRRVRMIAAALLAIFVLGLLAQLALIG